MKSYFLILFCIAISLSCNSKKSAQKKEQVAVTLKDTKQFDDLIFAVERLDTLSMEARLDFFREDGRKIYFYDENWQPTDKNEASFIGTVKHLQKDLYLARDYFISGKNQMTGIYKGLQQDIDWSKAGQWDTKNAEARKVGKFIYYYDNGTTQSVVHYEYTDFNKGYGSHKRIVENEYVRRARPAKTYKDKPANIN